MQSHDWNDLTFFLALLRARKLKEAGRATRSSDTTVARHIQRLEQQLGTTLFIHDGRGLYEPTDAAIALQDYAENIECAHLRIEETFTSTQGQINGHIRVSSVPIIVNGFLVPHLAPLLKRYPGLTVDLVPSSANLDLSKREADLALRFARPAQGGLSTKAQKLGALTFAVYGPATDKKADLPWITYSEMSSDLPQARWLSAHTDRAPDQTSSLCVSDALTAQEAIAHGLGRSLLPQAVANADARLCRLEAPQPPLERDIWMLSHKDQKARASVAVIKDWLAELPWA